MKGDTMTNRQRANWGAEAVRAGTPDYGLNGNDSTDLEDALANMMHYAKEHEFHWDGAVERARMHFNAEINGDD